MWLKLAISGAIIAFSTFVGYLFSGKARSRSSFFTQLCGFNEKFLNELDYERKPLDALLREGYTGDFGKSLTEFRERRKISFAYSYLSQGERTMCEEYFSMLGRGDALSQKEYFAGKKKVLSEAKEKCETEAKKTKELSIKLGLLFGLAVVILIV